MSMTKAGKAALYSAVIFPGAGLWWLKHYTRACIFMVPAIVTLWYITSIIYKSVEPAYSKLQREAAEGLIDVFNFGGIYSKLSEEIHRSLAAQQSQLLTVEVILIACWICSIISSYFAGKKLDLESGTKTDF